MRKIDNEWVVTRLPVGGIGPLGVIIGPVVCTRKHKFGGRCIFGKNLISEGEDTIWKCLPKGFGIVPYLVAPMQRDISRKYELNVWTLVGEIAIDVSGVVSWNVAVKYVFCF